MGYLAYAVRHVQATLEDHVEDHLESRGWLGPAEDVPFGATVLSDDQGRPKVQRGAMDEARLKAAAGNMVVVSFGNEPDDEPQDMGGGLMMVEHTIFVDCLGEKDGIALSLASDVKDLLAGRAPGTTRYVTVVDQRTTTPVPGWRCELADVYRTEGNPATRRYWQIVKATAQITYTSEDDGS